MIKIFFSFLFFIVILAGIAYGAVWFVDHKEQMSFVGDNKNVSFKDLDLSVLKKNGKEEMKKNDILSVKSPDVKKYSDEKQALQKKNRDVVNILVLNGGGPVGSAGKMSNYLAAKGYKKVTVSNAKKYTLKGLIVYYKKEQKVDAQEVVAVLNISYPNVKIEEATTDEQKQSDVTVIIGE